MKPKVLILKTDGTNCDAETAFAFKLAGGDPRIIHVNELRAKNERLSSYNILAIPGGFSYGDDIVSGKILAAELTSFFSEEMQKFIERKNTVVIGICNGFQVLIRTGLLPFGRIGTMDATLTNNDSGRFECRWINLKVEKNSRCAFLSNGATLPAGGQVEQLNNGIISYQVAHGEGKFFANEETVRAIEQSNLVVFRYADETFRPTQNYPHNPNGSLNAIAGICDPTGRILGLMPHPERFVRLEQHPNWRRLNPKAGKPQGLPFFETMIKYIQTS